jgi:acyl carrier protein
MKDAETVQDAETTILNAIRSLLERRGNGRVAVTRDSQLHDDLELDSLELAEFSVILEDDLGRDPYTEGIVPRTVGEVIAFYDG